MSFLPFEDIDFIEIEVSEKIEERNLKSFILSNLELNNKKTTHNEKIYLSYIKQLKSYQIFILSMNYKHFEFQLFEILYEKNANLEEIYDLYFYKNYLILYKNGIFYYFQKISENLNIDDFMDLIVKKFAIKINSYKLFEKQELDELKSIFIHQNFKSYFKNISFKNSHSFKYFLFFLAFIATLFFNFIYEDIELKKQKNLDKNSNFEIEKVIKEHKFKSLEEKIKPIILIEELQLRVFEYDENHLKIVIDSKTKESIYDFIEKNKNFNFNPTITYIENSKTFQAVLNVQISK